MRSSPTSGSAVGHSVRPISNYLNSIDLPLVTGGKSWMILYLLFLVDNNVHDSAHCIFFLANSESSYETFVAGSQDLGDVLYLPLPV